MKVASLIKELRMALNGGLVSIHLSPDIAREFDFNMANLVRYPDDPPHVYGEPWEINEVKVVVKTPAGEAQDTRAAANPKTNPIGATT